MSDLLLFFIGCRRTTPGERRVLMVLLVGCCLAAGVLRLVSGYSGAAAEPAASIEMGWWFLAAGLLGPIVVRWLVEGLTDRFF